MKLIDISEEFIVHPIGNGVKLVSPSLVPPKTVFPTVKEIMDLPFNVGFSNTEIYIQKINERTADSMGFESPFKAIGDTAFSVLKRESAEKLFHNNFKALKARKPVIEEEVLTRNDELDLNRLSFYTPWYGDNNEIIGNFGCTIVIGLHPLAQSLATMKNLGLLNHSHASENDNHLPKKTPPAFYFSKREKECIYFIVRGKTLKETACILGLSRRTVEYYFEQIKAKLGVWRKSDAIEKLLNCSIDQVNQEK